MKGVPSAQSWGRIQLRPCQSHHWSDTHMGCALETPWHSHNTILQSLSQCKAVQFSLHPLTGKEAAKNWSLGREHIGTWPPQQLWRPALPQHLPWEHQPCLYSHARPAAVWESLHWESTKPFYQGAVGKSPSPDVYLGPLSLKESGVQNVCQNIGLVFPQPPTLEVWFLMPSVLPGPAGLGSCWSWSSRGAQQCPGLSTPWASPQRWNRNLECSPYNIKIQKHCCPICHWGATKFSQSFKLMTGRYWGHCVPRLSCHPNSRNPRALKIRNI